MSKLLLLEDDLSLIDGLTYSLNKAGYEVDVARTVGEALERLSKPDCFALLLLDVTLPDGTGFSVCEQVRERGSTVPIIFLTASDEEVNVIRAWTPAGTTMSQSHSSWGNCSPASGRCCAGRESLRHSRPIKCSVEI